MANSLISEGVGGGRVRLLTVAALRAEAAGRRPVTPGVRAPAPEVPAQVPGCPRDPAPARGGGADPHPEQRLHDSLRWECPTAAARCTSSGIPYSLPAGLPGLTGRPAEAPRPVPAIAATAQTRPIDATTVRVTRID